MDEKTIDNKCPSCGAPLLFNPKLGKWKCDYCDSVFTLKDIEKAKSTNVNATDDKEKKYVSYHCPDCGAEIIADEQTSATFCVYCGNTAIIKSKLTGKFAPSMIIPFKLEKIAAVEAFKSINKGRIFTPSTFNDKSHIEKITGVYIPFWLYDIEVSGSVNADAKRVTTWVTGNTSFTKTDIYKLYRTGSMEFLKVPTDGSTRFENDIMNSIEPFDYKGLVEYNDAYLSGFLAEKYDVESDIAFEDAKARTIKSATENMECDMSNFLDKRITENTLDAKIVNKEYALLPVWMVNVKYNNKFYIFAMNGQTGKFIGNIPIAKKKVVIFAFLLFVALFLLTILISYIIYKAGA